MSHCDDLRVEELIQAYLAYLRGERTAPDLGAARADERMKDRALCELLDALTDMGPELPAFEDDPLAQRLAHRGPPVREVLTPMSFSFRTETAREPRRRAGFRLSRSLGRIAAALTLVIAVTTSLFFLGGSTPARAVQVGALTSDCMTTFRGSGMSLADSKPRVVVAATWAGEERSRFERVLKRFAERTEIDVVFATHHETPDRKIGETLEQLEQQGCAPDVVLLPQPALLTKFARNGLLTPMDDATAEEAARNYSLAWQELGRVDGTPYGMWFKAANKSIIWYNANAFAKAGIVKPPSDWEALKEGLPICRPSALRPSPLPATAATDGC